MYFPIKIYTTPDSFLIIRILLPLWFKMKMGYKPIGSTIKDRSCFARMSIQYVEDCMCLHAYGVGFSFRIRNNSIMRALKPTAPRIIIHGWRGWFQVFESAII